MGGIDRTMRTALISVCKVRILACLEGRFHLELAGGPGDGIRS